MTEALAPSDLAEALVWLDAMRGQRKAWQARALKAEEDRARLVMVVRRFLQSIDEKAETNDAYLDAQDLLDAERGEF